MQRNSVISLRVTPVAWQRLSSQAGADPHAAYGCVDWYLYQDAHSPPASARDESSASLIERTAAAAGAVVLTTAAGEARSAR